ncbi:CPXCG motif-containing cysteine-rich protein [Bdellovibrio sp. 22V]|nr:CPXCG motif-containing cysteine-rich protein [Bdellovibrio sp. 22V]WII70907.1 CPXCG motif-containing cysteine-rich protein [Bdellovibrio sp. 22V]
MEYKVQCPFCREKFGMEIYHEDGDDQEFVYDCEVCCRPIDVHASWDDSHQRFSLRINRGPGFDEMPI